MDVRLNLVFFSLFVILFCCLCTWRELDHIIKRSIPYRLFDSVQVVNDCDFNDNFNGKAVIILNCQVVSAQDIDSDHQIGSDVLFVDPRFLKVNAPFFSSYYNYNGFGRLRKIHSDPENSPFFGIPDKLNISFIWALEPLFFKSNPHDAIETLSTDLISLYSLDWKNYKFAASVPSISELYLYNVFQHRVTAEEISDLSALECWLTRLGLYLFLFLSSFLVLWSLVSNIANNLLQACCDCCDNKMKISGSRSIPLQSVIFMRDFASQAYMKKKGDEFPKKKQQLFINPRKKENFSLPSNLFKSKIKLTLKFSALSFLFSFILIYAVSLPIGLFLIIIPISYISIIPTSIQFTSDIIIAIVFPVLGLLIVGFGCFLITSLVSLWRNDSEQLTATSALLSNEYSTKLSFIWIKRWLILKTIEAFVSSHLFEYIIDLLKNSRIKSKRFNKHKNCFKRKKRPCNNCFKMLTLKKYKNIIQNRELTSRNHHFNKFTNPIKITKNYSKQNTNKKNETFENTDSNPTQNDFQLLLPNNILQTHRRQQFEAIISHAHNSDAKKNTPMRTPSRRQSIVENLYHRVFSFSNINKQPEVNSATPRSPDEESEARFYFDHASKATNIFPLQNSNTPNRIIRNVSLFSDNISLPVAIRSNWVKRPEQTQSHARMNSFLDDFIFSSSEISEDELNKTNVSGADNEPDQKVYNTFYNEYDTYSTEPHVSNYFNQFNKL